MPLPETNVNPDVTGTEPDTTPAEPQFITKAEHQRMLNGALAEYSRRVDAKLAAHLAPKEPEAQAKPSNIPPEIQAELASIRAENKRLTDSIAKERQSAREAAAYNQVTQALSGKVKPEAVGVVNDLFKARGLIQLDEQGPYYKHGEEALSIEDGITTFLQSREAQLFVSAPSALNAQSKTGARAPLSRTGIGSGPQQVNDAEYKKLSKADQLAFVQSLLNNK